MYLESLHKVPFIVDRLMFLLDFVAKAEDRNKMQLALSDTMAFLCIAASKSQADGLKIRNGSSVYSPSDSPRDLRNISLHSALDWVIATSKVKGDVSPTMMFALQTLFSLARVAEPDLRFRLAELVIPTFLAHFHQSGEAAALEVEATVQHLRFSFIGASIFGKKTLPVQLT